jgi:Transposase IS116/IS110/IS902 family
MKKFAVAAYQAVQNGRLMHAGISALLEALAAIDAQIAKLDDELKELARRNEAAWRLMSVPSIGTITALTFIAAIEDPKRFRRTQKLVDLTHGQAIDEAREDASEIALGIDRVQLVFKITTLTIINRSNLTPVVVELSLIHETNTT